MQKFPKKQQGEREKGFGEVGEGEDSQRNRFTRYQESIQFAQAAGKGRAEQEVCPCCGLRHRIYLCQDASSLSLALALPFSVLVCNK